MSRPVHPPVHLALAAPPEGASEPAPAVPPSLREATTALRARKPRAVTGGDPSRTHRQLALGRLTARERLDLLLDEDSFVELEGLAQHRASGFGLESNRPDTDGVVTGWARWTVERSSSSLTTSGSSKAHSARSSRARSTSCSTSPRPPGPRGGDQRRGGARIQEGITALAEFGGIFVRNVALSGVVPQLSVVLGPCAGGAAHSPALTDFASRSVTAPTSSSPGPTWWRPSPGPWSLPAHWTSMPPTSSTARTHTGWRPTREMETVCDH